MVPLTRYEETNIFFDGIRVFPSYLQAGKSYFIEQSKRRMIKEDLEQAVKLLGWTT